MKITTPTKVQKNISILSDTDNIYTVVKNGNPKTVIFPYFEWIEDFMEDLEIEMNRKKLKKEMQKSFESGLSDLVI